MSWRQKLLWQDIPVNPEDEEKFKNLLLEIRKSGLEYAITGYYGIEDSLRLFEIFSTAIADKIKNYLSLNEEIWSELDELFIKYNIPNIE